MSRLIQQFTVHPVGQGLFYSGILKTPTNSFSMVMDCGSLSGGLAIRSEADRFVNEKLRNPQVLDLLVISHFDADHVNQIGYLLKNGMQVKRLTMPFLGFAERLFLVLKRVETNGRHDPNDDDALRFAIDPTGEMSRNLGGDSEIYLVESDEEPIKPDQGISPDDNPELPERPENSEEGLVFDFDGKEMMEASGIAETGFGSSQGKLFKVRDSKKGHVSGATTLLRLMDFLFYKRPLKTIEKEGMFYDLVFKSFCEDSGLDPLDFEFKTKTIAAVRKLSSATEVKKWFAAAAKACELPITELKNLNTTALCLLHRNLPGLLYFLYGRYWQQYRFHPPQIVPVYFKLYELHIFKNHTHILKQRMRTGFYGPHYYANTDVNPFFVYPNTMLTSDCFLHSMDETTFFTAKYQHYLEDFWLMQIPHHGSKYNIQALPPKEWSESHEPMNYFINYGLKNRDDHPDTEVLELLENQRFFPVHDRQGLEFELEMC